RRGRSQRRPDRESSPGGADSLLRPVCVGRRRCGSPPPGEPILGTEEPHRHGGTNTMLEMLPGLTRIYEEWAEQYPDVQPLTIHCPRREKTCEDKVDLYGILAEPLEGYRLLVTCGRTELAETTSVEPRVSGSGF